MDKKEYKLTTGQMIDKIKTGMVAENQFGDRLTFSRGKLRWENGDLYYINIDQKIIPKWKFTY